MYIYMYRVAEKQLASPPPLNFLVIENILMRLMEIHLSDGLHKFIRQLFIRVKIVG